MELDRFKVIIETYGSRDENWPDTERKAAQQVIAESREARQLLEKAQQLDKLLDNAAPAVIDTEAITRRIMVQVCPAPRQETTVQSNDNILDHLLMWLMPDLHQAPGRIWRPLTAAALPLVMGIAIGLQPSQDTASLRFAEEIYLTAFTGETYGDWYDE